MNFTNPNPKHSRFDSRPGNEADRLPSTLSGLLESVIVDAEELDRFHYIPYSENWHKVRYSDACEICLAGCLIAGTLRNSHHRTLVPNMFSADTEHKLMIVDAMRSGEWRSAFIRLYQQDPDRETSEKIRRLAQPSNTHFHGWDEFLAHLQSLKNLLPLLREIDSLADEAGFTSFDHSH